MTIVILAWVLIAMATGLRFKVLVLVPVMIVGMLFTSAIMVAHAQPIWTILATVLLNAVGMQVGYLCGTFAHSVLRDQQTNEPAVVATTRAAESSNAQVGINIPGQFAD